MTKPILQLDPSDVRLLQRVVPFMEKISLKAALDEQVRVYIVDSPIMLIMGDHQLLIRVLSIRDVFYSQFANRLSQAPGAADTSPDAALHSAGGLR